MRTRAAGKRREQRINKEQEGREGGREDRRTEERARGKRAAM